MMLTTSINTSIWRWKGKRRRREEESSERPEYLYSQGSIAPAGQWRSGNNSHHWRQRPQWARSPSTPLQWQNHSKRKVSSFIRARRSGINRQYIFRIELYSTMSGKSKRGRRSGNRTLSTTRLIASASLLNAFVQ